MEKESSKSIQHDAAQVNLGQIWAATTSPSRDLLVVVARRPFRWKGEWCVRVLPVRVLPSSVESGDIPEIVIDAERNPVGAPLLVEWWNERPVLVRNLTGLQGEISEQRKSEIHWIVRHKDRMDEPVSGSAKEFREAERELGALLSADFKQLCC